MRTPFQFVLDLFDAAPPAAAAPPQALSESGAAPRPVPVAPVQTLTEALGPVQFAHPQANRVVVFQGVHIAYAFARAKRKTIGFSIGPEGLWVRAPKWVSLKEVDAALHAKSAWILRKLTESQQRHALTAHNRIDWQDGALLPYLGRQVRLCIDPAQGRTHLMPGAPGAPESLLLGISAHAQASQIRDSVQAWLMRQARALFEARLNHFAPLLGVQWKKLSLSNAGTRWGSARADGAIRLHWRLIHLSLDEIDYVVAHELSHLREMNHSPQFWDTVRSVMPDYALRRQRLKNESLADW
ncbi:MAG: M48 family metallopeptidase [Rhodoferax sp.]